VFLKDLVVRLSGYAPMVWSGGGALGAAGDSQGRPERQAEKGPASERFASRRPRARSGLGRRTERNRGTEDGPEGNAPDGYRWDRP
jgi:hypothetical protein